MSLPVRTLSPGLIAGPVGSQDSLEAANLRVMSSAKVISTAIMCCDRSFTGWRLKGPQLPWGVGLRSGMGREVGLRCSCEGAASLKILCQG